MKIKFIKEKDNQGSFVVCDEANKHIYHFLTQIKDKEKLKETLKKNLEQVTKEQELIEKTRVEIEAVITSL